MIINEELQRARFAGPAAEPGTPLAAAHVPARWAAAGAAESMDALWRLLVDRGSRELAAPGESALAHAVRCADFAQEAGAAPELITASLLHDVGHLLRDDFCITGQESGPDRHAMIGAAFLSLWFGPAVTEPVRLHGEAKRYLCAVEPGYARQLRPGASASMQRNGGPMSADEIRSFLGRARAREAVLLRRWDDRASVDPLGCAPGATDIARFQKLARRCLA